MPVDHTLLQIREKEFFAPSGNASTLIPFFYQQG
jgi:hypothetical protein